MAKVKIAADEFVTTWQKAGSVAEVADTLGTTQASVSARACQYRAKGINLKKFTRVGKPLDVEGLCKLAEDLGGAPVAEGEAAPKAKASKKSKKK